MITLGDVTNFVSGLQADIAKLRSECLALQGKIKSMSDTRMDVERYYSVVLSTADVARLHGVSTQRVLSYAHAGLIEQHPSSTDGKMAFRASTVLTLDFDDLRRRKAAMVRQQKYREADVHRSR